MMLYKREHLVQNELTSIKRLTTGEFNEKTLQKLVTKLSSNFEPYKPDKAILQYLNNHTRQLGLDPSSFANPKDRNNKSDKSERQQSSSSEKKHSKIDRFNKKRKRTDASDFKSKSRDSKTKSREFSHSTKQTGNIPVSEQCRNAGCQQRGTHLHHRHKDCRYKDGAQPPFKHPNLGKAPAKSKDNKSKRILYPPFLEKRLEIKP